jgi:hypothetical protein
MRRIVLVSVIVLCSFPAFAQQRRSTAPDLRPPTGACIWANMIFSDGAVLCAGPGYHYLQCVSGRWKLEEMSEREAGLNCRNAPFTKTD